MAIHVVFACAGFSLWLTKIIKHLDFSGLFQKNPDIVVITFLCRPYRAHDTLTAYNRGFSRFAPFTPAYAVSLLRSSYVNCTLNCQLSSLNCQLSTLLSQLSTLNFQLPELNGLSCAAVWHLYGEEVADGWCYVGHVYFAGGFSFRYVPSHEEAWYVCVVGVPYAVCCAFYEFLLCISVDGGLWYGGDVATA